MSHHGDEPLHPEFMKSLLNTASFRGAVGLYPEGKLDKTDEGSIQFGVTQKDGKVILEFGTPVAWVGMNPQQAADLASLMLKHARAAGRASGQVITMRIGS